MTAAPTPAAGTPGPAVRAKGSLLLKAGGLLVPHGGGRAPRRRRRSLPFPGRRPQDPGYQTSTMLTGSMAPLINPGDVVVTVPTPVSSLKTGDIITYKIPVEDRRVETHRIVKLTRNGNGSTTLRTKGDANNGADPWEATIQGDTVDVQAATVPYLGTVIRTLRQPAVLMALTYAVPGVLVLILLVRIWRKGPDALNGYRDGADGAETQTAG